MLGAGEKKKRFPPGKLSAAQELALGGASFKAVFFLLSRRHERAGRDLLPQALGPLVGLVLQFPLQQGPDFSYCLSASRR